MQIDGDRLFTELQDLHSIDKHRQSSSEWWCWVRRRIHGGYRAGLRDAMAAIERYAKEEREKEDERITERWLRQIGGVVNGDCITLGEVVWFVDGCFYFGIIETTFSSIPRQPEKKSEVLLLFEVLGVEMNAS